METQDHESAGHQLAKAAKNQSLLREVNERIAQVSEATAETQFLCECANLQCQEILDLSLFEYETVRSSPVQFPIRPGHDVPGVEHVVSENERYAVVEKIGEAGEISTRLDPRSRS
jgi:hypothetical protein